VSATAQGFSIHTGGLILLIVGIAGLVISLMWMTIWTDRRARPGAVTRRDGTVSRESDLV
jgi:uncharacterized iron-regulated membrane protein